MVVGAYCRAREADATHEEIVEALGKGIDLPRYSRARRAGIKHHLVLLVHLEGVLDQLITGMNVHRRS